MGGVTAQAMKFFYHGDWTTHTIQMGSPGVFEDDQCNAIAKPGGVVYNFVNMHGYDKDKVVVDPVVYFRFNDGPNNSRHSSGYHGKFTRFILMSDDSNDVKFYSGDGWMETYYDVKRDIFVKFPTDGYENSGAHQSGGERDRRGLSSHKNGSYRDKITNYMEKMTDPDERFGWIGFTEKTACVVDSDCRFSRLCGRDGYGNSNRWQCTKTGGEAAW